VLTISYRHGKNGIPGDFYTFDVDDPRFGNYNVCTKKIIKLKKGRPIM